MSDNEELASLTERTAMNAGPLGRIYDLDEAAAYLRVTKQAVARAARRHGIGSVFGRDLRFSDADVKGMWDALRCRPNEGSLQTAISQRRESQALESLRKRVLSERAEKLLRRGRKA